MRMFEDQPHISNARFRRAGKLVTRIFEKVKRKITVIAY